MIGLARTFAPFRRKQLDRFHKLPALVILDIFLGIVDTLVFLKLVKMMFRETVARSKDLP